MTDRHHTVSDEASRVLRALREWHAYSPLTAMTDATIARRAGVSERSVIELSEELAEMDVAVIAWCGGSGHHGGRYIETDPERIDEYAARLHQRAKAIHGRAARYNDVAARLRARRKVEGSGQGRLFAETDHRFATESSAKETTVRREVA